MSFIYAAIFRIAAPSHSENSLYYPVKCPFKDSRMDVNTTLRKILTGGTSNGDTLCIVCQVVSAFCTGTCVRNVSKVFLIIDYPFNVAAVELGEALQCHQQ
jgi:hypothetical protein